jgi:hypothetical protein
MAGCSVCTHPERDAIERALLDGETLRSIGDRFGLSKDAVSRHKPHIGTALVKAQEIKEVARADSLLDQVKDLNRRALRILERAEERGDVRECCAAIRECRGVLELLAKVAGEIPPEGSTIVNIMMNPEWVQIQTTILQVLEPYPEAKVQLAERLAEVSPRAR